MRSGVNGALEPSHFTVLPVAASVSTIIRYSDTLSKGIVHFLELIFELCALCLSESTSPKLRLCGCHYILESQTVHLSVIACSSLIQV